MSRVLPPLAIVSGSNNLVGNQFSDLSLVRSVIIANISPFALYITGVDTERWLQPMEVDRFACANGLAQLTGAATQIFTSSSFPANACLVTLLYESDPDPGGAYPFALGSGSVSLTQPTQVINDGFPITTTVVEATPSGQSFSFVQILNDGTINIYQLVGGVRTHILSLTPGTSPAGYIDAEASGIDDAVRSPVTRLKVYEDVSSGTRYRLQFLNFIGGGSGMPVDVVIPYFSGTDGQGNAPAIILHTNGSVEVVSGGLTVDSGGIAVTGGSTITGQLNVTAGLDVTGSGAQITGNSQITGQLIVTDVSDFQKLLTAALGVAFTVGQITRVSHFSGTGPGAVAHGLGTTPDIVLVMPNSSSAQSWAVNSIGATNCTIAIGAGIVWTALAIKF